VSDVITTIRSQLEKRLRELEPHVKEHAQIKDALDKLASAISPSGRTRSGATAARAGAKAPARGRSTMTTHRARLRKGQPSRSDQFLEVLQANPGIKISDAAKRMGVAPNYLYRVRNELVKAGRIKKQGQGFAVK
jgi:Winged helix-turn-helix DNA-binding